MGHGLLVGYSEQGACRVVRGRRFLCSNRHRQRGCGRTFSVLLDNVLRGFVVRALTLVELVIAIVGGLSIAAAWKTAAATSFSLTTGYRLWRRLRACQPHIRAHLARLAPAPACAAAAEPWAQLLAHLRQQLGAQPFAAFQLRFQLDLLA